MLLMEFCSPVLVREVSRHELMRPLLFRLLIKLVSSSVGPVSLVRRLSHRSLALVAPVILGLARERWGLVSLVGIVCKIVTGALMVVTSRQIFALFLVLVVMGR